MKEVHQTKFGHKEGNCYAACLASIFECPIEHTPDFGEIATTRGFGEIATTRGGDLLRDIVNEWLRPMGFVSVGLEIHDSTRFESVYMVKVGQNPNGLCNHAVVSLGTETVHDPHHTPIDIQPFDHGYEYEMFVPMDPALYWK